MSKFETGTVVKLKSGGPKMTCTGEDDNSGRQAECQWFAGSKLEFGYFPFESLEVIDESESKKK